MARDNADTQLLRFASETGEIREAPEPVGLRVTTLVLAAFLTVGVGLSAVARVDRVVTSERGRVIPSQGTILFQALDASIIKTLDAREGEQVQKGQLLATLDPTFASADVDQLTKQVASLDAQIARASAEQAHTLYEPRSIEPEKAAYERLQKRLFDQRAAQRDAQVASFDAKIAQTRATIKRLEGDEGRYGEREKISGQIEGMRQQLVEKQAGSLLNLLIASDARLEMLRTMESGRNALIESRQLLGSLQADRDAFLQQWLSQSSQDLVTALGGRDTAVAQLSKASRHKDLVQIVAPADAVVLTRAKVSVGSVLREGDTLMILVPLDAPIEAEITIASSQVGFVRAGDPVTLKVDAFNFVEHGFAEGRLNWISEGSFSVNDESQPVEPYYKARASIDRLKFTHVPAGFRLIPGMTLAADVHIGDRSVLAYVVTGAARGLSGAMREP